MSLAGIHSWYILLQLVICCIMCLAGIHSRYILLQLVICCIMSLAGIHSCYILFQLVEEMATSAGLQCELDPVLCQALRAHKGACESDSDNSST